MILKGYLFSLLYAAICLGIGFLVYKIPGVSKKITRKIVHILIGFEWVILYHFFGAGWQFLSVCLFFLAVLAYSYRKKLMPMISSDDDNSPGTVYYCVAMTFMAVITLLVPNMILPFGIGVICTSLGDGFAGLFGQIMSFPKNHRIYGNKTLIGTILNFVICFASIFAFCRIFNIEINLLHILILAAFATELELFTGRGLDNITITLGVSLLSYLLINFDGAENYVIPILLTPLIIVLAYNKKVLTVGGIIVAILVDAVISFSLGNSGFIVLLSFLVGGIVADKIKKQGKKAEQKSNSNIEKSSGCRNHIQVLANSIVASICALSYYFTGNNLFIIAFIASLAEALADTAASGIGVISGRAYDLFRLRKCVAGESGGMSVLGTLSSLVAALIIALIALGFGCVNRGGALIVILSAFLGAVFDSFLGSLLQVKYRCEVCGAIVESKTHCCKPTLKYRGISFVDNNFVNLFGTLFSAIVAILLAQ